MTLASGTRLGPYEIVAPLGSGGMGEVYRARDTRLAREALLALPTVESPLPQERFEEAAELFRAARRAGVTLRSSVDCLIAACAIRHGLTVVHRDRDFSALARVSSLQERNLTP